MFQNVASLNLSSNNISTIPIELVQLFGNLTELNLSQNTLNDRDTAISNCSKLLKLQKLNLTNNKITELDIISLSKLKELQELYVQDGNQINNLPESLQKSKVSRHYYSKHKY